MPGPVFHDRSTFQSYGIEVICTEYRCSQGTSLWLLEDPETGVAVGPSPGSLEPLLERLQRLRERALFEGTTYQTLFAEVLSYVPAVQPHMDPARDPSSKG